MATEILSGAPPLLERVRPEIRQLPRYNAGLSAEYVREHYGVSTIAKLGSNENPYGPSPRVIEALAGALGEVALYPESSCDPLRAVLAEHLKIDPARLIFGNGSEDLISIAAQSFLAPASQVVTFAPSFGLHVMWPQAMGATVHKVDVQADYRMDLDEVLQAITPETRMVLFGNPSNPVGSTLSASDLERILAHLSPATLLVFDEAYLEYASADPSYPDFLALLEKATTPWLILRTFSKAYGLAGLRIGYAIASSPVLIDLMDRVRSPFNVNRLAQVAAIAALGDLEWMKQGVAGTVVERTRMRSELGALGFVVAPSLTNFLFVKTREDGSALAERLLARGVIVKPWREPGYTDHVRVSIGSVAANDQFLAAWKELAQ